jgi:hypothetical protein
MHNGWYRTLCAGSAKFFMLTQEMGGLLDVLLSLPSLGNCLATILAVWDFYRAVCQDGGKGCMSLASGLQV